jgi:RNA polymerase sigma factor (sigma-70 family)
MRTPADDDPVVAMVAAARDGDRDALAAVVAEYLPLVYNIVGRAMNGHPDVDDVVQETMLRAIARIGELRDPRAFRSWLVAIGIRQVRDSYRDRLAQPLALESVQDAAPVPDFADRTVERLGLSGQRQQVAEATRWLDDDDRPVLSLWWQEAAGELTRADLADGLGLSAPHAAVRVARMKERLLTSRMVVHALRRQPRCDSVAALAAGWDGEPSPLWRKRLARHVRGCSLCRTGAADLIPAEWLLGSLPLLAVPAALHGRTLTRILAQAVGRPPARITAARGIRAVRHGRRAHALSRTALSVQPKLVAVSLAVVTCAAGGTFAVTRVHHAAAPAPAASATLTVPPPSASAVPLVTHQAQVKQAKQAKPPAVPPVTATSQRKGVSAWNFTGVQQALADSGASWYYNWATTPNGITAPSTVSFVPMIWGAADVTSANLAEVSRQGSVLLGFNEPDLAAQSNMTPAQALALWPQLMATGLTLGSPAVSAGAATPGGWLDQFMSGAKQRGYHVNFIAVHWYGGDFETAAAVQQLESYLQAVHARYQLPIWLTEFALTSYSGGTATFPAQAQQAAFLTAATQMLDGLSYVQRYAWFALPASAGSGTTGLFNPGPSVTEVGRAFESAQ